MSNRILSSAFLVVAATCFVASAARAQIASYVDERGKVIYTNDDSQQTRRGSSMSKPVTAQVPTDVRSEVVAALAAKSNAAAINVAGASPKGADPRLDRIVQDAAQRHSLDPALVKAVISTESGWNTRAISQKGAVGLMQLVPATAQRFGVGNPFDPEQNVEGGTMYLKSLLDRYNGDLSKSLAAYNAGEGAVDANRGIPPYRETRQYVKKVTSAYFRSDLGRGSNPAFTFWSLPRPVVRQELGANGRIIFTNE